MTQRRWGLVVLSAAFFAYALGQEWISIHFGIIENHLLDVFVGISAAVAGIVALDRRPGNPIGWLLFASAVAWHANPYILLEIPAVTVLAVLVAALHVPLVGHLVLAYPTGRLTTRLERVLVIMFYGTALVTTLADMAVYDPRRWGCERCSWQPAIWPDEPAHLLITTIGDYLTTLEVLGFFVVIALRFARSSRLERHNLLPLWVGALMLGVIEILGTTGDPYEGGFLGLIWQIRSVLLILVPLIFLYGLLTDRTAKTAIGDLVLRLEGDIPTGQLGAILAEALGDPELRIVYAAAGGDGWVTAEGVPTGDPVDQQDRHHRVTIIQRDHRPYAALVHDDALSQTLVTGVASAAGLAIENEWLHAELRAQLEEVRASRARIVAAGDEERRRVERDLHDGAQQRLLALALALRLARRQVASSPGTPAGEALDRADAELQLAIVELRELARGIHPAILTDEGLAPAVRALAARATFPVEVTADLPERLPGSLEATAYFAVSEALANIDKHAAATTASVTVGIEDGALCVLVADDGRGGADLQQGSGLRGLRDRVAAVAGTLTVVSPPGAGTTLLIRLPVPVEGAVRVVIADDALLLRRGVAALLGDLGHEVVGEAGDAEELLTLAGLVPDVVIVDIRMPPTHTTEGLDAAIELRRRRAGQAVLVLSAYVEAAYAVRLLAGGAAGVGYLLKDKVTDPDQLADALHRLRAGESVIDADLVTSMLQIQRRDNPLEQLSAREREVLALMAEGRSNLAIADRLCLTQRTVESHVRSIFTRLDLAPGADDHRRVLAVLKYLGR